MQQVVPAPSRARRVFSGLARTDLLWAWCFLTVLALLTYREMLRFLAFSPEDAYFYAINQGDTLAKVLRQYVPVPIHQDWYRPTCFFTSYWILTSLWDWHNLLCFKLTNLVLLGTTATLVYRAGTLLFRGRRLGALLGATYFAFLPLLFIPLFDVTAFDLLYQIFILATIIAFLRYLEAAERGGPIRLPYWSWLLFLLALTAKETTVALPGFLAWLFCLYPIPADSLRRKAARIVVALSPFVASEALYLFVRFHNSRAVDVGAYRTTLDSTAIDLNLQHAPAWILRFLGQADYVMGYFATPWSNQWATLLVAAFAVSVAIVIVRRPGGVGRRALILVGWILCFAAVPVYSGGFPWHFATSAAGFALLWGACLDQGLLAVLRSRRPLLAAVLIAFVLASHVLAKQEFARMLYTPGQRFEFYTMLASYLHGPRPIPDGKVGPQTFFMIKNDVHWARWYYGNGDLFNYVYRRHGLRMVLLDQAPVPQLAAWLDSPFGVCVDWDIRAHAWKEVTAECRDAARARLAPPAAGARGRSAP